MPACELGQRRYLKLSEAAALGYGGLTSLKRAIRYGRLPAYKRGRIVVLKPEDLEALVVPARPDEVEDGDDS